MSLGSLLIRFYVEMVVYGIYSVSFLFTVILIPTRSIQEMSLNIHVYNISVNSSFNC
mgnify:CR=1 FL=1